LRRVILVAGILYTVAALAWAFLPFFALVLFEESGGSALIGTPLGWWNDDPLSSDGPPSDAVNVVLILGLLLLAQWALLRPGAALRMRLVGTGRPLKSAVIAASAMAMLLTVGAFALLAELPDWWAPILDQAGEWGRWGMLIIWVPMLALWGVWAWIFFLYWRQGDRYTQLGRMIRGLVAGSLVEALVAVPVHVWVMRQRDCYCARGTYTTLVLAGTVLLWAFGPGIILLYMREKYRRAQLFPICAKCGYDLRGSTGLCPECGTKVKES
ncbi:MAG: hypothetical protein JSU86_08030, partial [Phycisphaerales bacterium]